MALEQDLELMDDYLSDRMDTNEKAAFEDRLRNEQSLSEEFKLQQSLVQGIKQARIAELKSMLNSIPVTTLPPSQTALITKIGGWAVVTGLVITSTYFFLTKNEGEPSNATQIEQQPVPVQEAPKQPVEQLATEEIIAEEKSPTKPAEKPSTPLVVKKSEEKPVIQAYDPTTEESEIVHRYEQDQLELISNAFVTSSMEVETHHADKKYTFHYVFKDDKLVLYGSFEKHLYEILEFISEHENKKTVVLYYKTNYYLLDITKSTPTALTPIKNQELLKKLQEHRGK